MARELPSLFDIERKVRAQKKKATPPALEINLNPGAVVVGLDLSLTSTGVAGVDGAKLFHTTIATSELRGLSRVRRIRDKVLEYCYGRQLVVVEGVAFAANASMHSEICGLWMVVVLALWESGVNVVVVPPSVLKKFVAGSGNAKKDDMKLAAYKRWGVECATSDEADAVGLAHFGAALGGLESATVEQRVCLTKARLA